MNAENLTPEQKTAKNVASMLKAINTEITARNFQDIFKVIHRHDELVLELKGRTIACFHNEKHTVPAFNYFLGVIHSYERFALNKDIIQFFQ